MVLVIYSLPTFLRQNLPAITAWESLGYDVSICSFEYLNAVKPAFSMHFILIGAFYLTGDEDEMLA